MTTVEIQAGTLLALEDTRTVTGLLLPYNEPGSSNLGRLSVKPHTVSIFPDLSVMNANRGHNRERIVASTTSMRDTPEGIVGSWRIAEGPDGDTLLAEIRERRQRGEPMRLSAEVRDVVIRDGWIVGGETFGAAFVDEGAYPSAALMAQAHDTPTQTTPAAPAAGATVQEDGPNQQQEEGTMPEQTQQAQEGQQPQAQEGQQGQTMTAQQAPEPVERITVEQGAAVVPDTLMASGRNTSSGQGATLYQVAAAIALYASRGDRSLIDALPESERDGSATLFAALTDVKATSAGSAGINVLQPQWVGNVWAEREYRRRYCTLFGQKPLTSYQVKGYRWTTPPVGGEWTGNKTAVPSNGIATEPYEQAAKRWAGGNDLDRSFWDFGETEFIADYIRLLFNDYARYSDVTALTDALAGGTNMNAGTVPSGVNAATVSIVDGALALSDKDIVASYAIAAPDIYRELILQPKDQLIATLSQQLDLDEGELAGFRIVPAKTGHMTAGTVAVGGEGGVSFYEMPGVPIRTTALDMVKAGVDEVAFGYFATTVNKDAALQVVYKSGVTLPGA